MSEKIFSAVRELKFDLNVTLEKYIDLLWEIFYTFSNVDQTKFLGLALRRYILKAPFQESQK